jgi:purine-binding chemotaxis protein CheW
MPNIVKRAEATAVHRSVKLKGPLVEYLAFALATEQYAVPIGAIREILKLMPITEIPRAPGDVIGIVSVRGMLVTLFDLRRRLGLPVPPPSPRTRILLTEGAEGEVVGVYVDEVLQVYRLAASEIENAEALGGQLADHVVGLGRPSGALLTLIDLRPLLGVA